MKKSELRQLIREEIINEEKVPKGFKQFFIDSLEKMGLDDDEVENEAQHAFDNMKHDMKQGDSIMAAFEKACNDLHIDSDGIEPYI